MGLGTFTSYLYFCTILIAYIVNLTRGCFSWEKTPARVSKVRIFFVCQRVPFPPDRGDKIVTFQEVRHLSQRHEVHVFCLGDGDADLANVAGVVEHAASVTAVPVTKLRSRLRSLLALGSHRPLSMAAFDEARLHDAIIRKYDEARPDLIIIFSCNVAQYAEHFAGVPRIMQFHDLDYLKWVQFAAFKNIALKWIYQIEAKRLLAYERSIAHRFSHSLVYNAAEQADFGRLFPGIEVSLVGNGVDLDHFQSSGINKRLGSIIFTGVMDYFPNVDGITWFCDEVLPQVQNRVPEASLTICGNRPTAAILRLAKRRGISVTGWVPDTRPHLASAEVCVAPLRVARGVQNKPLEALAMGLPCVASGVAWRGTAMPKGAGILVSDDAAEFAEHVTRLLQVATFRMAMAGKARAAVETMYRWETQLAALDSVVAAATEWPRKRWTSCSSQTPPQLSITVNLPTS
jgi:sugar transferase (PEP-CTERM/EpsH1 system associated)